MGLFHATIRDVISKIKTGKIPEAKQITDDHILAEHHFGSDLVRLQRAINTYHEKLHELQYMLTIDDASTSLAKANDVESQVLLIKEIVKRLVNEDKIEIE